MVGCRPRSHPRFRRASITLAAVTASISLGSSLRAAPPGLTAPIDLSHLSSLQTGQFTLNRATRSTPALAGALAGQPITAFPLNSPPVNGFQAMMVVSLTDAQDHNDFNAHKWDPTDPNEEFPSAPPGNLMPFFQPAPQQPLWVVATLDTGASATILSYSAAQAMNLATANREGGWTQPVGGVGPDTEDTDISDGLGVFFTGVQNAVSNGTAISVPTNSNIRGDWNNSILTAEQGSVLPNILGVTTLAHWQATIENSKTTHITVNNTTYRTPRVTLKPVDTAVSNSLIRVTLHPSPAGPTPDAFFFPDFSQTNLANDPQAPTTWVSETVNVSGAHSTPQGNGSFNNSSFIFDTGAQLSIISSEMASAVGYHNGGPDPSTPDFYIDVLGVGGITQVPGIFINSLSILTANSGTMTWTHVPVVVVDVNDGAGNIVPGILGMNLFNDRDLIINGGPNAAFFTLGPQITPQWTFNGGGTWGDDTKWSLGSPDGPDLQANFTSAITAPATITVDPQGFTVGSIKFDNANRYTITGTGTISIEAFSTGVGAINVVSGSHTISAPVRFNSDTTITVTPSNGSLTLSGDMSTGSVSVALTKTGAGTLSMKHVRVGTFAVNQGNAVIASNGTTTGTSKVSALSLAGGTSPSVKLDLTNNAMVIDYTGTSPIATVAAQLKAGYAGGSWNGNGIDSSTAAGLSGSAHRTAIGIAEASAIGSPTTFRGQSADSTSLLLRYVFIGDSNLDGKVDTLDFNALAGNFGGSGKNWWQGDSNYDGVVDTLDFNALASNFGQQLPDDASLGANLVPEPSCLAAVALLAGGIFASRRRRPGLW